MVNPGPAGPSHQADVAHLTYKSTVEGLFSGCELISRPKLKLVAQLHSLQAKPSLARRSGPVFQTKQSGQKKLVPGIILTIFEKMFPLCLTEIKKMFKVDFFVTDVSDLFLNM